MKKDKGIFDTINNVKAEFKNSYSYVKKVSEMPEDRMGLNLEKIYKNSKLIFHFLEFLLEEKYIDLDRERGIVFIDDKISWEFILKSSNGFIRINDHKGYSVAISSVGSKGKQEILKKEVLYIKKLIEENVDNFLEFRSLESKKNLDKLPLDNFLKALGSLTILFRFSDERNKKENFGLIETLILMVNLIDTILRYLILLKRINERRSLKIEPDLTELYYQEGDRYLSERKIFSIAEEEIDFGENNKKEFFEKINNLYDLRNRAVHRYAITNFQYIDIRKIIDEHRILVDILFEIIVRLEKEQADLDVGFVRKEHLEPLSYEEGVEMIDDIFETKINPFYISKKIPDRDPMFSDRYKGGVNPKIKKIINKFKKELSKKKY